jgi:hypothetical protein
MNNTHTPAPWKVSPYNNITSRNGTVAKTEQMPGNYDSERQANARLIAAAPDLLSALEAAVARVQIANEEGDPILSAWLPDALSAIAKAKGAA